MPLRTLLYPGAHPQSAPDHRPAVPLWGWAMLLAFNALLLLTGYWLETQTLRNAEAASLQTVRASAETAGQILTTMTEGVDVIHQLAARRATLMEEGKAEAARALEAELRQMAESHQFNAVQIGTIDRNGITEWSSSDPGSRAWLGDRMHYLVHHDGLRTPYVSIPLVGRVSGRWSIQFTRALLDKSGQFAGVSVVSLDPMGLSGKLAFAGMHPTDTIVVYRREDGRVLMRNTDLEPALRENRIVGSTAIYGPNSPPRGAFSGIGPVTHSPRFFAFRNLDEWPVGVQVSADAERLLADARQFNITVRLSLISLALASAGFFLWLRRARINRDRLQRTEQALRQADADRGELGKLLQDVNTVIYTQTLAKDGARRTNFVSPNLSRLLGLGADIPAARVDLRSRVMTEDLPLLETMMAELERNDSAWAEYRLHRLDGRIMWVNDRARVVERRPDGRRDIVGSLSDVTEKHVIAERAAANSRMATLGQMATSLAHELSQPIAIISLAAENALDQIAREPANGGAIMPRLQRIIRETGRSRDVIAHLRIFGRADPGEMIGVPVMEVVESTLLVVDSTLAEAAIEVTVDAPPGLPPVRGNPTLLEQVLLNLIGNARDAFEGRPEQGRRIWISARLSPAADQVELHVRDNAGGIPAEAMPKIFEFFYTTKSSGKGTGLGLALCREYLASMGGTLTVANTDGGADFTLVLRTLAGA